MLFLTKYLTNVDRKFTSEIKYRYGVKFFKLMDQKTA